MTAALDAGAGVVSRRSALTPALPLIIAGFTLLTILFFRPWLAHMSSALIGPPEDNMQDFWNSWHAATAHGWRDLLFTSQIRYPEGTALSYHSFAWPQIVAVALLTHIFGTGFATLVLLHNLTLLATFPLAAVAMFFLARHLLGDVMGRNAGAVAAGFIFAFNPWHVAQVMHHAHVAGIEFLPLFVLFYLLALEQRSYHHLIAAAAMAALGALSCWYFLFYAFYFMVFQLLYLRIRNGQWPRDWMLAAPPLCLGGTALLLTPWLIPMMGVGTGAYLGSNMFVADPLALVAFPPTHLLGHAGADIYAALTGNAWEDTVYLGLANLAVLAWAMTRKADQQLLRYALGGMIFFTVIAAGETLHVGGYVTPLHLPGVILAKLPFFANVRTPARAMVMVYLFLGLGVAQACVMAFRHHTGTARASLALAAILILLDFTPANLATTQASCPVALDVIANDPDSFGVLDLPRGYGEGNAAMMLSACHGHPIVAGETARKMGVTLADRLVTGDLVAQRRQLAGVHVKYIVLHRPRGDLFRWNKADGRFADYVRIYRRERDDGGMMVLSVY
jgi:hypothetical protein